jgi:hypothetical protein
MNQPKRTFLSQLQRFTAYSMITASAVRNCGASGTLHVAQDFCAELPLRRLARLNRIRYATWLDKTTDQLLTALPGGARWGTARKVINIFVRSAVYIVPLATEYDLASLLPFLEVPLDGKVAEALKRNANNTSLPRWRSIKSLTPDVSRLYQLAASKDARRKHVHRADLDVYYWPTRG